MNRPLHPAFHNLANLSMEVKAERRRVIDEVFKEAGLPFSTNNGGVHLIVRVHGVVIDFWPGPLKWRVRGEKFNRNGYIEFLNYLDEAKHVANSH